MSADVLKPLCPALSSVSLIFVARPISEMHAVSVTGAGLIALLHLALE